MGWSTSLLLVAIGAVLRFAVTASVSGINIHTIGVILMIVGAVGFLVSLLWMVNAADRDRAAIRATAAPPAEGYVPPRGSV
ncbi:DUF6458 family protein [Conexibacter sp. DBS9H8]|uniref:DUF6458 family protein n=1 Tax=Conexibacter sp. DBS9H8 TaxID=2937801 RepID=UPI00200C001E|nr:DUF6458 family protein [Conexibacter sp. DBS9H8]